MQSPGHCSQRAHGHTIAKQSAGSAFSCGGDRDKGDLGGLAVKGVETLPEAEQKARKTHPSTSFYRRQIIKTGWKPASRRSIKASLNSLTLNTKVPQTY